MPTQIQLRRGTAAEWTAANPTLAQGEIGYETDTRLHKVGDGTTAWVSLPYAIIKDASAALVTAAGASTARTAAAHFADAVSVKDFGAVGDGLADDAPAINAAIASATSGVVYLPPGTYRVVSIPILIRDNVTLAGAGRKSIIRRGTNLLHAVVANYDYAANTVGNVNVTVRDLAFDGGGDTYAYSEFLQAIDLIGVNGGNVTGCHFFNLSGDGVYVSSTIDGTARANYSQNIRVAGNHFGGVELNRNGVSVIDAEGVTISGNVFTGMTSAVNPGGIDLEPNKATQRLKDITISGNVFQNCRQGIQALNGVGATTSNLAIVGNVIATTRSSGSGILVSGFPASIISGNTIRAAHFGLYVAGSSGIVISGNVVYGTTSVGMYVIGGFRPTITQNTVLLSANDAIRIEDSAGAVCTGNSLSAPGSYAGVHVAGTATDATVNNNSIDGGGVALTTGVRSTDTSEGIRGLRDNVITGCATAYALVGSNDVAAAAPTTGTWRVGEVVWNSAPAGGGAPGWVCTVAGTPGTWKAMANLAP